MTADVRVLLLADSHLGFDLPIRRIGRRRRGYDFIANYESALQPALDGEVDLVVHGGDVFDRSEPVASTAHYAYTPLVRVAERGVPVFIVPGNHERSRLPHRRFIAHPNIHIFDRPRTFVAGVRGTAIGLSGFPYERRDVRTQFAHLLEQTEWRAHRADHHLLCVHHCVEGAMVGPADFTFTTASDVIRAHDVPPAFTAVFSGHIHRHQVLTTDLRRRPVAVPVMYPGSIERTSFAELAEPKGFMIVQLGARARDVRWQFRPLPARPMIQHSLTADGQTERTFESSIHAIIAAAPRDAVVSIRIDGTLTDAQWRTLAAARLRAVTPATMNVEIRPSIQRRTSAATSASTDQLSFC